MNNDAPRFYVYGDKRWHAEGVQIAALRVGEKGYYRVEVSEWATEQDVENVLLELNGGRVLPKKIILSAICGSMFGWDTPAAKKALQYLDCHNRREY